MKKGNTSKMEVGLEFENLVKNKKKAYVLFYASWCPFSQRFLPIFEKYTENGLQNCLRIKIDDKASLCEKYSVEIVPTVLLFELGVVTKRLDGNAGAGLSEEQLARMLADG